MNRTSARLGLAGLALLATMSCGWVGVSGRVQVTAVVVGPGTPMPAVPLPNVQAPLPTPAVPNLYLEYAGNRTPSGEQFYTWNSGGSGGSAVSGAVPVLVIPQGASVDILVSYPTFPAVLWVAELDRQGAPIATAALTPTSGVTAYTPTTVGQYRLQVTAEWTYQNFVTGIFELSVQP